jgi:hypothetical protein
MNQKEFAEALVRAADSDAADNEPKRSADSEAELLRDAFVTFSHRHDFKAGMIVREKAGCSLLPRAATCFFVTLELRDDEPPFDVETPNGTAGIGTSLYMLVEKDEDGDRIPLWVELGRLTGHYRKVRDLLSVAAERTVRAVWPYTEDTDWCGGL